MDLKKTIRNLKIAKRLLLIVIIAYVAIVLTMNTDYLSKDNARRILFSVKQSLAPQEEIDNELLVDSGTTLCETFKDGFAVYDSTYLTVYSHKMQEYSRHRVSLVHPVIRTSDRYIILYDRGGTRLYVFDTFDEVYSLNSSTSIINASVSRDGYLAVATEGTTYKGIVSVYNRSFSEIFKWSSADSYVLDVLFTSTNTVSAVTIQPNRENTSTIVYHFNYLTAQQKNEIKSESTFPVSIAVKADNTIEVVTDSSLISFRTSATNQLCEFNECSSGLFCQSEKYAIIASCVDSANDLFTLRCYDYAGNIQFGPMFMYSVRAAYIHSDLIFIADETFLHVLDTDGNEQTRIPLDNAVERIRASQKLVLISGRGFIEKIDMSDIIQ